MFLLGIGLKGRLILSISRSITSLIEFAAAVKTITTKVTSAIVKLSFKRFNIAAEIIIAKADTKTFSGRINRK